MRSLRGILGFGMSCALAAAPASAQSDAHSAEQSRTDNWARTGAAHDGQIAARGIVRGAALAAVNNAPASAEAIVQRQVEAYARRDIEAFAASFSEDAEAHIYPGKLLFKGRSQIRDYYGKMFAETPGLKIEIVERLVIGNKVIDEEQVIVDPAKPSSRAIAIYTVENGKIARMEFLSAK